MLCLSSHPQRHTGSVDPVLWKMVLGTLQWRVSECSCQEDLTSRISTFFWLGFTSPIIPCLKTVLLKKQILSSQKEGRNEIPKRLPAHSSKPSQNVGSKQIILKVNLQLLMHSSWLGIAFVRGEKYFCGYGSETTLWRCVAGAAVTSFHGLMKSSGKCSQMWMHKGTCLHLGAHIWKQDL